MAKDTILAVRVATLNDSTLLWNWANDSVVRQNAFSQSHISWADHLAWFEEKLASPDTLIYLIECNNCPAGQVRYDRTNKSEAEIDISIAPTFRGQGLGIAALNATKAKACKALQLDRVIGIVKVENIASAKAFERAGFLKLRTEKINGHPCDVFAWVPESTISK